MSKLRKLFESALKAIAIAAIVLFKILLVIGFILLFILKHVES